MANGITTAFWSVTINNPDERDMAIIERGYPDYCRKVVWTLEQGEEGTPHIQAYVKLQRQQRMSFVRKLFPGGHFRPLTSDEYILNTEKYVQKNDETTRSAHIQQFNDPLHTIESVIRKVVQHMLYADPENVPDPSRYTQLQRRRLEVEYDMVSKDFRFAKIFVSATYKQMWKQFSIPIFESIWNECENSQHTHTHTHSDEKFSRDGGITSDDGTERDDASEGEDSEESWEQEDGEDHTEGEGSGDETDAESGDHGSGEETSGEED